jgi:Flp pilus assembly CpaE family ATPase
VSRVLELATEAFTGLVVDLEDLFHREQMRVILACDTLVMLTRLDFVSLVRTRKSLMYLEREGIDLKKVEIVAGRTGVSGEVSTAKAAEALGRPIQHAIPENAKCVIAANNLARLVALEARASNVAKAIKSLAASLAAK